MGIEIKREPVRSIKIGGLSFRVEFVQRLLSDDGNTKLNGHIRYGPCLIQVEIENNEQVQKITVLHEIMHGILTQAGIEEDHEKLVEILAYGLFGVLINNPDFVRWIDSKNL